MVLRGWARVQALGAPMAMIGWADGRDCAPANRWIDEAHLCCAAWGGPSPPNRGSLPEAS